MDKFFTDLVIGMESEYLTIFFKFITFFGSTIFVVSLLVLFLIFRKDKLKYKFIVSTALVSLINNVIKIIVRRDRPSNMIVAEHGFSFPSGHSMCSVFVYGFIICNVLNKDSKYYILNSVLLGVLTLLICFSRVYLRVHYFSDVLVGIILGLVCLLIFNKINCKKEK